MADFALVIDERPNFRPAYWQRALARFRSGDYDEAQADVAKFQELGASSLRDAGPGAKRFLTGKTLRLMALELDGKARDQSLLCATHELQAAIAAGQSNAEVFQHLGAIQELLGNVPAALASYSQGLTVAADNVPLRNQRGWAYVLAGKFELAGDDFAAALRLAPDNPETHAGLGYVRTHQGAAGDAETEASAALLSGSNNYLILHNVACIYGRLSQTAMDGKFKNENLALAALNQAVNLWRKNPAGPDEIKLIRGEEAFSDSLRSRPESQRLLTKSTSQDR